MACQRCNWMGYVESIVMRGGQQTPIIEQCPACQDTLRYSLAVQRRAELMAEAFKVAEKYEKKLRELKGPCQIIPFRRP